MYKDDLIYIINSWRNKGIVVDTNLLILELVGNYDSNLIAKFKRTVMYTHDEYFLLNKILSTFTLVIINQPILTESFNLISSFNKMHKFNINKFLLHRLSELKDCTVPTQDILSMDSFVKFGFADASIDNLATDYLIITDDFPLYGQLSNSGKHVINFNHIRGVKL